MGLRRINQMSVLLVGLQVAPQPSWCIQLCAAPPHECHANAQSGNLSDLAMLLPTLGTDTVMAHLNLL
jgi:hypothetical protein